MAGVTIKLFPERATQCGRRPSPRGGSRSRMVLALVFAAICGGCSASDSDLERRIAAEVAKGRDTELRMRELTEFQWDRMHVFGPYSSPDHIERELGFAWLPAASTGITDNDGISLLVFVRNDAVVRHVTQPRTPCDFAGASTGRYSPETAVFRATPRWDGAFIMVPARREER